ncbi:uncharacterized protein DEA37_0001131, partial [Paragonimus westermani]
MLKGMYNHTQSKVRVNGRDSTAFPVHTGVRQGAIASPVLFNFCIDWVMHKAVESCMTHGKNIGVSLGSHQVTDLDYADDIALLAETEADLQFFADQVVLFGAMLGLKINPDKSKVMAICSPVPHISISGVDLENVDSFRYLGSQVTVDGSCEHDILCRMSLAQVAFQQLYTCLFSREDVTIPTKIRVYVASV